MTENSGSARPKQGRRLLEVGLPHTVLDTDKERSLATGDEGTAERSGLDVLVDEPTPGDATPTEPTATSTEPVSTGTEPVAAAATEPAPAGTTSTEPSLDSGATPGPSFSRWVLLVAGAVALVTAFVQEPGRIVDDTKLPLVMAPLSFLGNALHLWNPNQFSGTVQSLTYGYFFPMGSFFALGSVAHVPVWITERVWLALLLTTAFWGVIRLAEALGIGTRLGRVLGAVAYTVAPIVVIWAAVSAALLAVVLLPWVLVPLVRGSQRGSPRRAAAASGVAVAFMGGVNATVVVAVLPLGALWLLTRRPGPRRRALMTWWVLAVVLACFWWFTALVIQSRYGYNYLPYTETPAITTATASLFEALRGASFWTAHFTLGGPLIGGAWTLVSSVGPILGTTTVAAFGLVGLARRRTPERTFLVASLALGVLVIAVGYSGPLGGPASHAVQDLLARQLAPLRNISKFSPDVALPLSLGLASAVSAVPWGRLPKGARVLWSRSRLLQRSRALQWGLIGVVVAALLGASAPFWQARLYPPGGFRAIPSYWYAAAHWLDVHQGRGTALLVPGASFGEYTWGKPLDEPLSVLLGRSWTVRSLVPFGSDGNTVLLDTVEASLDQGVPAPGMAEYLARAGIDEVVVRNDLNLPATGAPPPAQVQQVLSETPGLRLAAAFGPVVRPSQATLSGLSAYDTPNAGQGLRSVEIYRVLPAAPVVRTYPASDPVVVSGSPASLLPLAGAGVLGGRATVLDGDPHGGAAAARAPDATWADTDGNQRRDMNFGAIRDNVSYVLGPGQRTSAVSPGVPENYAVVRGVAHQTVAAPLGVASISASSYGSTALSLDPAQGPAAAFDQNPSTAWVADDRNDSIGQWLQVDFGRQVPLYAIAVEPLADSPQRPVVTRITVSTARGSVERRLVRGVNLVSVPRGDSSWLRITLSGVRPPRAKVLSGFPLGAGLASVGVPGVRFQWALRLPSDGAAAAAASPSGSLVYSFSSPLPNPNLYLGTTQDDDPQMTRWFDVPRATQLTLTGTVSPLPGAALDALLPAVTSPVQVSASSTLDNLPRFAATNLLGGTGLPWIAGLGDTEPSLTIHWSGARSVSSLVLEPTTEAAVPRQVEIIGPSAAVVRTVPAGGGTLHFPAMVTDTLTVRFLHAAPKVDRVPASGLAFFAPVGLRALRIPALGNVPPPAPDTAPLTLPCGQGPALQVDGSVLPTAVTGTVSQLRDLQPMSLRVCTGPVQIGPGEHLLEAGPSSGAFKITGVIARGPSAPATPALSSAVAPPRQAKVAGPWTARHRTVRLGAGPASYLVVAQNYNAGWRATFDGRTLTPVRVDGWQQAWMVPAGAAGTVTMVYMPDAAYRAALAVGAVLLVALGLLALLRRRRKAPLPPPAAARRVPRLVLAVLGVAVLAAVAGPLALTVVPLALVGYRWGSRALISVAGLSFMAAGVVVAASAGAAPGSGLGAFGTPAQVLAAVAIAAVLVSLVTPERGAPAEAPAR